MKFAITRTDFWAALAGGALLLIWYTYTENAKQATPATDFFTVREVNVPDFVQGTPFKDVTMVYDRTIKEDFFGTWVAELHPAADMSAASDCFNSGTRAYKVGEKAPEVVTLQWFMEHEGCALPAGKFILETTWRIEVPGYPVKIYTAVSNIFTVLPSNAAQSYITKEQIEQLERAQELLDNPVPLVEDRQ